MRLMPRCWKFPWGSFAPRLRTRAWLALTVADCHARLGGKPLWTGLRFVVRPGQPPLAVSTIVLIADAQPTGGYPRIACIIEADLYHLTQIRLGDPVHFIPCSLDEAHSPGNSKDAIWNS